MLLEEKHKCRGVKNVALGGEGLRGRASPPFYFYAVAARADVAFKVKRKKKLDSCLARSHMQLFKNKTKRYGPFAVCLAFYKEERFLCKSLHRSLGLEKYMVLLGCDQSYVWCVGCWKGKGSHWGGPLQLLQLGRKL